MTSINLTTITTEQLLALPKTDLDFYHHAEAIVHAEHSAYEIYCRMTNDSAWWLKGLFHIRDIFCTVAGVRKIDGFKQKDPQSPPQMGQRLEFWSVHAISPEELILTAIDRHLGVVLSIAKVEKNLTLTTRVKNKNTFGKLYMIPVVPIHGKLVEKMLKKVALQEASK